MTFEEFAAKFVEVASELPQQDKDVFTYKQAIETAWQALGRLLVEENLAILPNDPIQGDDYGISERTSNTD